MKANKVSNIFNLKNIIRYFLIPYIIFNILTLSILPLPWFDEIWFTDITQSLAETGKYTLHQNGISEESLIYGPLYFNLQIFITNLLGFDCFQFRLLGFVSGILIIIMGIKILQSLHVSEKYQSLYVLLISFQEIFFRGLHFGRMDLTAALPIMISLYLYLKYQETKIISQLLVSRIAIMVLLSCAFLTTPRIIFLILPFGALFSIDFYRNRKNYLYHSLNCIIILGVASSYLIWILYKFSTIDNFLQLVYKNPNVQGHLMAFELFIRSGLRSYIYILPSLLIVLYGIFICYKLILKKYVFNISLVTFIFVSLFTYIFIVVSLQPYSTILFPFLYLEVVYLLSISSISLPKFHIKIQFILIYIILAINITAFIIRVGGLVISYQGRNAAIPQQVINTYINKGSNVVADYKYFYTLNNNDNNFNPVTYYGQSIKNQEELFNYDYLLVEDSTYAQMYRSEKSDLVLITKVSTGTDFTDLSKKMSFWGSNVLFATYDGYLYKRIRKQ